MHKSSWMCRVTSKVSLIFTIYCCLGPNTAKGLPPDRIIHLKPESGQFAKSPPGSWQAHSQDESIATAMVFDTQEIFIESHRPGTTLLLLSNMKLRSVLVWQISVSADPGLSVVTKPDEELLRVCQCTQEFKCRIQSAACTSRLHQYLQKARLTTSQIQLLYTPETLKELSAELNKQIKQGRFGTNRVEFLRRQPQTQGRDCRHTNLAAFDAGYLSTHGGKAIA